MDLLRFRAMNTEVLLAAEGDAASISRGFERARQVIEAGERRFTRFSEDSELSRLNRSAGDWFHASPEMIRVVSLACSYAEQTSGLFNPSIIGNLERIGYDRSMDRIRADDFRLPSVRNTPDPDSPPLEELILNPDGNLIRLPPGLRLDLGGIAKGWIAEQAALTLARESRACLVDAGGDMFMAGLPAGEPAWTIGLEDPRNPGQVLAELRVPPGAVTTSSVTRRAWKQGEVIRHHLIDPRTGEPAETDWLSVTVVARHADTAEVYAKALLIAGPGRAEVIAQNAPEISYLAVDRDGNILGTSKGLEPIHVH